MSGLKLGYAAFGELSRIQKMLVCACAFVLFLGLFGALVALTGVELPALAIVCAIIGGAAVCAALWAYMDGAIKGVFLNRRTALIAGGVLIVVLIILNQVIARGGAYFINAFIAKVGAQTQFYDMPYVQGGTFEVSLFCLIVGGLVALVACILARRGTIIVPCVLAIAACCGLSAGWLDAGLWIAPFALGLLGCAGLKATIASGAWSNRAPASVIVALLAFFVVSSGIGVIACGGTRTDSPFGSDIVSSIAWKLKYGDATFAMPGGKLKDLGALDDALNAAGEKQVALHIETSQPTYEYLRGFVGERYTGSSWEPLDSRDVMADRGLFYWLDQAGFSGSSQIAQSASAAGFSGGDLSQLSISVSHVRDGFAYEPYGSVSDSGVSEVTDFSSVRRDADDRDLLFDPSLVRRAYLVQEKLEGVQGTEAGEATVGSARTYLDAEGAYREFIERAYLEIPDEVSETFASLYGAPTKLTAEQAKIVASSLLGDTVSYSTEIVTGNGDEDFVTWFLNEQRSGYSVHYATAATLLMRYYGVPARYVEGYVLNTAALDAEASGSEAQASDEASDTTNGKSAYDLSEKQAHAWVEYYLDGVGWVPFDVTPGYGDPSFFETTENIELQDAAQNWSIGEAREDSTWTPPEAEENEQDKQRSPIFDELEKLDLIWPLVLLGFLVTLACAFYVRSRLLHARLAEFLSRDHESAAVPFAYLVQLLSECGNVSFANKPYSEQTEAVEAAQLCSASSFKMAAETNDAALFSTRGSSPQEISSVLLCIEEVHSSLNENTTKVQRFVQRHIRCLW